MHENSSSKKRIQIIINKTYKELYVLNEWLMNNELMCDNGFTIYFFYFGLTENDKKSPKKFKKLMLWI